MSTSIYIIVAVIGGFCSITGSLVLGWFTLRAAIDSKQRWAEHVTGEGPMLARFETKLDRVDSKLDSALAWQGEHTAQHLRERANRQETD